MREGNMDLKRCRGSEKMKEIWRLIRRPLVYRRRGSEYSSKSLSKSCTSELICVNNSKKASTLGAPGAATPNPATACTLAPSAPLVWAVSATSSAYSRWSLITASIISTTCATRVACDPLRFHSYYIERIGRKREKKILGRLRRLQLTRRENSSKWPRL